MPQLQATVIMEITMWIDANLDKNITIAIAAKRAGYSKRHLQRIFKDHTGLSLLDTSDKKRSWKRHQIYKKPVCLLLK